MQGRGDLANDFDSSLGVSCSRAGLGAKLRNVRMGNIDMLGSWMQRVAVIAVMTMNMPADLAGMPCAD